MEDEFTRHLAKQHAADVLRNIGVQSIMLLALLNGGAAIGMIAVGAPLSTFLGGFLFAWIAALISYVIAQMRSVYPFWGYQLHPLLLLAVMVLPVAISLLLFCLGLIWASPIAAN